MSLPKNTINNLSSDPLDYMNGTNGASFLILQSHPDDYSKIQNTSQELYEKYKHQTCDENVFDMQKSKLSDLYYDKRNISLIQKMLIKQVFQQSNGEYLIENQNPQDLMVVMMYIYSMYSQNLPYNIGQQISDLNTRVVNEITPDIISQLKMNDSYYDDVFGEKKILDLPKNMSNKGLHCMRKK